jgi:hypothetical protein
MSSRREKEQKTLRDALGASEGDPYSSANSSGAWSSATQYGHKSSWIFHARFVLLSNLLSMMSEFSMYLIPFDFYCNGSFFYRAEKANEDHFLFMLELGHPFSFTTGPANAFYSRRIVAALSLVEFILRRACDAEVVDLVVAPISINMINFSIRPFSVKE